MTRVMKLIGPFILSSPCLFPILFKTPNYCLLSFEVTPGEYLKKIYDLCQKRKKDHLQLVLKYSS